MDKFKQIIAPLLLIIILWFMISRVTVAFQDRFTKIDKMSIDMQEIHSLLFDPNTTNITIN